MALLVLTGTVWPMEEVPREEWPGPQRMDPVMLDKIMNPGLKWYRLSPGVDFSIRVPYSNIQARLYRAARRRGARVVLYKEPDGSIMAYASPAF